MNVPRELVVAMLNRDPKKPWGLSQVSEELMKQGLPGMARRVMRYVDQLEALSQEEGE